MAILTVQRNLRLVNWIPLEESGFKTLKILHRMCELISAFFISTFSWFLVAYHTQKSRSLKDVLCIYVCMYVKEQSLNNWREQVSLYWSPWIT